MVDWCRVILSLAEVLPNEQGGWLGGDGDLGGGDSKGRGDGGCPGGGRSGEGKRDMVAVVEAEDSGLDGRS